uniref:UDENN domain-containing protein n=1 Tax=Steinernema glaseri TaxID=37863 RepID=A0A1I7ZBM6_9BILA
MSQPDASPDCPSPKSSTSSFESIQWSSDETEGFVTRAKVVRYQTLERYNTQLKKFKENNQLFTRILVIKLVEKSRATDFENRCAAVPPGREVSVIPSVTYSYPLLTKDETDVHFPPTLFYPDFLHVMSSLPSLPPIEEYTVVLTTEKGDRTYAYCTRYNKQSRSGADHFFPEVFVVVSPFPAPAFYYTLSRSLVDVALKDAVDYNKLFASVHILKYPFKQQVASGHQVVMGIHLNNKYRPFQTLMSPFLSKIGLNASMFLFLAILAERRIIVTGSSITDISLAIQVLVKMIQPLQWPHTLIPVVPDSQVELCHNPTPYICGLLRHNLNQLKEILVSEISVTADLIDPIVFDVDQGVILPSPLCNKKSVFVLSKSMGYPDSLVKRLMDKLQKIFARKGTPQELDAKLEDKISRWYARQFGHFCHFGRTALSARSRRIMVSSHPQKSSQAFLQWFLESGMYQAFVQLKLDFDLDREMIENFEKLCKKYAPKITKGALKERGATVA